VLRPGIKLIALVSILGISAYLLFIPETTDIQRVKARQGRSPKPALSSPSLEPVMVPSSDTPFPADPGTTATTFDLIAGLPAVLEKATPEQRATADQILGFVGTGNMAIIRDLSPEQLQSLAELLTRELGAQTVGAAVESYFGLPSANFLAQENPAAVLTDLLRAVQSESGPTNALPLIFSDGVQPDGSVYGNVHVIPAGTKRVYAAFENAGALQGLDRVLAIWRNPSDDRMVYTEYEPVRVGSTYNYVWLELADGWPVGFYQLDLFHPSKTSQLLASRSFNVR
jgi:hypothetical protein